MRSVLYALATGLAGAALLHILIILTVPHFTGRDAYSRIAGYQETNQFFALDAKKNVLGLSNGDPFVRVAVCQFSVEDQPVHLLASGAVPFWSYAIYDSASNEVFSMNDRTSIEGELDTIIASPAQLTGLRKNNPDIISQSILVEMANPQGYVVLRAIAPSVSYAAEAKAFLSDASCDAL